MDRCISLVSVMIVDVWSVYHGNLPLWWSSKYHIKCKFCKEPILFLTIWYSRVWIVLCTVCDSGLMLLWAGMWVGQEWERGILKVYLGVEYFSLTKEAYMQNQETGSRVTHWLWLVTLLWAESCWTSSRRGMDIVLDFTPIPCSLKVILNRISF